MKKNVVILTGAGISAESGIKTFRDSDGLWENYRVEEVATHEAWERNPRLVTQFYNNRRKEVLNTTPNAAHTALVQLEKDFHVEIITQNIDNLHERAGSKNIIHLHGEITKLRSDRHPDHIVTLNGWEQIYGEKDPWGEPLRPHIVWFGEAVPMIEPAMELCRKADFFIVIGTSLNVYPAAGLLYYVPSDCKIYLVDPKTVNTSMKNIAYYQEKATTGVPKVVKEILAQR